MISGFQRFITLRSPFHVILFLLALSLFFWFCYRIKEIILYFAVSVIIAYLLNGPVVFFIRRRIPRGLAILLVFFIVGIIIAAALVLFIPAFISQINNLGNDLPQYLKKVETQLKHFDAYFKRMNLPVGEVLPERVTDAIGQLTSSVLNGLVKGIMGIISRLYAFIIIPLSVFYLLKDAEKIRESFLKLFPSKEKERANEFLVEMDRAFGGFIRSRLKLCVIVGVFTGVALFIFKVRYSLILGIIAGVFEFVPYVGPILGAIPALLVGLFQGKLFLVLCLILIVQAVENMFFTPRITSVDVGLHPLLIVFGLIIGGKLWGVAGVILSVPVLSILKISIQFILPYFISQREPVKE